MITIIIPAWMAIVFGVTVLVVTLLQIYITRQQAVIKDLESKRVYIFMDAIDGFIDKIIDAAQGR